MRRLMIFLLTLLGAIAPCSAYANEEWFYMDLSTPTGAQIILSATHFSGHLRYEASVCPLSSEFHCYEAKGFQFAIPKADQATTKWIHNGARYEVRRTETFNLFGRKVKGIWIHQRVGTKAMWFLYSREAGLIAFTSKKPKGALFVIQNECGFGASSSCGSERSRSGCVSDL